MLFNVVHSLLITACQGIKNDMKNGQSYMFMQKIFENVRYQGV